MRSERVERAFQRTIDAPLHNRATFRIQRIHVRPRRATANVAVGRRVTRPDSD